jgi:hypothetical protein
VVDVKVKLLGEITALLDNEQVELTEMATGLALEAPETVKLIAVDWYAASVGLAALTEFNVTLMADTENVALAVKVPADVSAEAFT